MVTTLDQEVVDLEKVITHLDTLYEAGADCIHPITGKVVSDPEYDQLRKRLATLYPDSEILKTPTASALVSTVKKVKHHPPMTSISKAIGTLQERTDILEDWQSKVVAALDYKGKPEEWAVQAYKRDGVAVSIYYENGKLKCAGLRPRDGITGEDVTANIVHVEGVAAELWEHDAQGNRTKFLPITCCLPAW
jgi:DNA ligase (NAD+)